MVHEMDNAIGEIVVALEDKNELENTIVVFASDNGGLTPDVKLNPSFLAIPKIIGICNTENRFGISLFQWVCENYSEAVVTNLCQKEKCLYRKEV